MAHSMPPWPEATFAHRPSAAPPSDYEDDDDESDIVVIGIDFGTTYSGAAWATAADFNSKQINLVTSWPGTGREEGKAPTELFYEDEQIMWGYEVPSDADPVRWFKLLLLKDEDLDEQLRSSEFILRARKMLKEHNKTAVDLIADYLRALWAHILDTITKSRGELVVEALTFNVVITVPAIWKGYARQGMQEAAKKAGILDSRPAGTTTLTFAPEPEAAALSTLCEPGNRPKKGDVYLICDAGGGTVDLICYQVDNVAPLAIREVAEGIGGLCGGILIDEAFENMCKARLGRQWDRLSKMAIKEIMKGEWEYGIKPQYNPVTTQREYIVGLPAEACGKITMNDTTREPHIRNGRIHFKSSHIESAFTEAFSGIDKLIRKETAIVWPRGVSITGIILVGGLGASPYLYKYLKSRLTRPDMIILQSRGIQPRTAICRGAVYKGFLACSAKGSESGMIINNPVMITSIISRVNVGIGFNAIFDSSIHLEEDRKWDEHEAYWQAKNQLQWFIKRGEDISIKTPISHSFSQVYDNDFTSVISTQMILSDDAVAPTRCPLDEAKEIFRIHWAVSQISPGSEQEFTSASTGKRMKKVEFEVEMIPSGAFAEFVVKVGGRKLAQSKVNIDFQS